MSEVSPDNVKIENSEIKRNNALVIPLIIIFCLMVIMVVYTSQNVRRVTVNNIHEVGYDKISSVSAKIENYLDTTKGMLWVTAETVDQILYTIAPVPKLTVTRNTHSINYLTGNDLGYIRKSGKNSLAVLIAESFIYIVLLVKLGIDLIVLS